MSVAPRISGVRKVGSTYRRQSNCWAGRTLVQQLLSRGFGIIWLFNGTFSTSAGILCLRRTKYIFCARCSFPFRSRLRGQAGDSQPASHPSIHPSRQTDSHQCITPHPITYYILNHEKLGDRRRLFVIAYYVLDC